MKAILLVNGTSERDLRKLGHDLERALEAAQKAAPDVLRPDQSEFAYLRAIAPFYRAKASEYLVPGYYNGLPPLKPLWDVAHGLHSTVNGYVRGRVLSALEARRATGKSMPTEG